MEKLLEMVSALIEGVEAQTPATESREWYLLNNLRRFRDTVERSSSRSEVEGATRLLNRFCIDSLDWDDPLFKAATAITEQARLASGV